MSVVQAGQVNLTALIVPGVIVQIIPPSISQINGVPTNVMGVVGTTQWGAKNAPGQPLGSMAEAYQYFGNVMPRKYDALTAAAVAVQQGASNIRIIRVTDGTDTSASGVITAVDAIKSVTIGGTVTAADTVTLNVTPNGGVLQALVYAVLGPDTVTTIAAALAAMVNANPVLKAAGIVGDTAAAGVFNLHYGGVAPTVTGAKSVSATETITIGSGTTLSTTQLTVTAFYTGTLGNSIGFTLAAGSKTGTTKASVAIPGLLPEVFDNISGSGATLWANLANAINLGQSGLRGPSQLVTAASGFGASPPVNATTGLTGGTDGATTITGSTLIGTDGASRTGMYAMRKTPISIGVLADCDDSTTWTNQVGFGLVEGIYMIGVGPASDTIANAITAKATAGIDSYAFKLLFGDWITWNDTVNGVFRLVSPQGFIAGLLSNLGPQESSLNKQLFGIVGTQKTQGQQVYSDADLQALGSAGIDVISNPSPGGSYFSSLFGRNTSSEGAINGDNYTRMTNYIAFTINSWIGRYIGLLGTADTINSALISLRFWLSNLVNSIQLAAYSVGADTSRLITGVLIINIQAQYLAVITNIIANIQGGQTVIVTTSTPAAP